MSSTKHWCPRCERSRALKFFNLRRTGRPASYCKDCQRHYAQEHYQKNKRKDNARRYKNRQRQKKKIKRIIHQAKARPCMDCGKTHPYWAMEFDHRDPSTKKFNVADGINLSSRRVVAEIAKCDVVCCLCHRYRTHAHRGKSLDFLE